MQDELCSNVSLRERSEHAGLSEEKLLELDQYSIPFYPSVNIVDNK